MKLLPCPFCGDIQDIDEKDINYFGIAEKPNCESSFCVCCAACKCTGPLSKTYLEATEKWSERLAKVQ